MSRQSESSLLEFVAILRQSLETDEFVRLRCTEARRRIEGQPQSIQVRPVRLRGKMVYQVARRVGRQELHENVSTDELLRRVQEWFPELYRVVLVQSTQTDCEFRAHAQQGISLRTRQVERSPAVTDHDRTKHHVIPEGRPCPFLQALGVMNAQGRVLSPMQDKFRQINRFLEMVRDVLPALPEEGPLRIVDFGCGLSYLTFAVHHLLANIHAREVNIEGIDRNAAVIERCRRLAGELQCGDSLRFTVGEIGMLSSSPSVVDRSAHQIAKLDLAISLHACDTATDAALAEAVRHRARVILSAPCCQHELSPHLEDPGLRPLLEHGILRERLATLVTDALRAEALEAAGYRTQVLEFVDTEHTPKNLLIRAIKRRTESSDEWESSRRAAALTSYGQLKQRFQLGGIASDRIIAAASGPFAAGDVPDVLLR